MSNKGIFITFEGGEGTGKTTQIKLLSEYLKSKLIATHLTREPGGCDVSEKIREIVVKGKTDSIDELSELLLFSAARHEHVRQKIKPLLEDGKFVISDRFYHSTYVYQSFAGGIDFDFVEQVTKRAIRGAEPNLTIILDIDPVIGLDRARERVLFQDELRFENKELVFHNKVRQGFIEVSKKDKNAIVIDASGSVEQIHKKIIKVLEDRKII